MVPKREQQKLGPVGVLYAWCGPFVTLALLLMALLSPAECQFVFLEIHGKASEGAKRLVAGLWFEGAVADFVLGDVLNYEIFRSWVPDVIISATMLACLKYGVPSRDFSVSLSVGSGSLGWSLAGEGGFGVCGRP